MASDDILAINQHALLLGQMLWEDGKRDPWIVGPATSTGN